jgi:hypothetical protein
MYIKEFLKNDILINSMETNPKYNFLISKEGSFILKNRASSYRGSQQNQIVINDFLNEALDDEEDGVPPSEDIISLDFSSEDLSFNLSLI